MNKIKNSQKGSITMLIAVFVIIALATGSYFYINKNKKADEVNPDSVATTTTSYTGEYVDQSNSIDITHTDNIISFAGQAVYPRYDQEGNFITANTGDLEGTTTIVGNKARWTSKEWQLEGQDPCIIDFTFNTDDTVNIDTSEGSTWSCGWGLNVNFEGLYTKVKEQKPMEQNTTELKQFQGSYLTFNHPKDWKVEEDEQYGMITITRLDKDNRPDIKYDILRSKFDRDSKEDYKKFLLEYSPFMENINSEEPVSVSGKLDGTGTKAVVSMEDEEVKTTAVFSVIHFKMKKPLSEYFDAVTISGYHAATLNGAEYFTAKDIAEVDSFLNSIDVVY